MNLRKSDFHTIIEKCLKSKLIRNVFSSFDFEQLISINVVTQLVMFGTGDANVNLNTDEFDLA